VSATGCERGSETAVATLIIVKAMGAEARYAAPAITFFALSISSAAFLPPHYPFRDWFQASDMDGKYRESWFQPIAAN
jgi:hypothetical protein